VGEGADDGGVDDDGVDGVDGADVDDDGVVEDDVALASGLAHESTASRTMTTREKRRAIRASCQLTASDERVAMQQPLTTTILTTTTTTAALQRRSSRP
jgi:hypothetical protein